VALVANALTTIARVCRELGISVPASSSDDEVDLEQMIAQASDACEAYCDRTFLKATVTEKVRGYGSPTLRLSRYPLVSITSVSLSGSTIAASSDTWSATPETEDAKQGVLRHLSANWEWTADVDAGAAAPEQRAGTERPLYTVVYVGGYVLPSGSPRTLPYDIERACLLTAVALYRNEGRNQDIVSESVMSASRTYAGSTVNTGIGRGAGGIIPDNALPLLEKYKRWS
jgi:hypothetical protein